MCMRHSDCRVATLSSDRNTLFVLACRRYKLLNRGWLAVTSHYTEFQAIFSSPPRNFNDATCVGWTPCYPFPTYGFLILIRHVTLWPWPLSPWPWTCVLYIGCHVVKVCTEFEKNRTIQNRYLRFHFNTCATSEDR